MGRTEARIFASIWRDSDFRALRRSAQGTYFFLLSSPDLSHAGTIPLRLRRWSSAAEDFTVEALEEDLAALEAGRFIVVDPATEEILIRSLIRRDKVARNPGLFEAAVQQIALIESLRIRAVVRAELQRLAATPDEVNDKVKPQLLAVIQTLSEGVIAPSSEGLLGGPPEGPPGGEGITTEGKGGTHRTEVIPPAPLPSPPAISSSAAAPHDGEQTREDVERLCKHLADRIEGGGSKRPTIGKGWRDAARRMLDLDGRTEEQIHRAIDWAQDSEFWCSRIMSMPKLREKYDVLRLQAQRSGTRAAPHGRAQSTTDARVAQALDVAQRLAAEEAPQDRKEIAR